MLSDQDKRRIEAEESYRADLRRKEMPVKGITEKAMGWHKRIVFWFSMTLAGLFLLASCMFSR